MNLRFTLIVVFSLVARAQTVPLPGAVRAAIERYPSTQVSEEQVAASRAAVAGARTAFLPRLDTYAQLNRATHNNVFGMLLPQSVIPPISGPVTPASLANVWSTAAGALVTWEPFDFGLRQANVAVAQAGERRAQAAAKRTQFEVAALTADAYLTVAAAEEMVRAAEAAIARANVFDKMIGAVVDAELRPGVDRSRSRAEIALAQTQLAQAREAAAVSRATLTQFAGPVQIDARPFLAALPAAWTAAPADHPRTAEQRTVIAEAEAREKALDRSWYPRFNLQGAAFGRGSGAHLDGTSGAGYSGLGPNTGNWALGFSVFFPVFDLYGLRTRREAELHLERAEQAKLALISRELSGERERAQAHLDGARAVAQLMPARLEAARDTEKQALARYQAGLGTAIEIADAQRLRTQAEIDDALARLGVWRAALAAAVASGSLDEFLELAK